MYSQKSKKKRKKQKDDMIIIDLKGDNKVKINKIETHENKQDKSNLSLNLNPIGNELNENNLRKLENK